jgi:hypothetical protein
VGSGRRHGQRSGWRGRRPGDGVDPLLACSLASWMCYTLVCSPCAVASGSWGPGRTSGR